MTNTTKPVKRETFSSVRARGVSRAIVVELNTTYLRIKPKGTRLWFTATYDQIYNIGARNAAEAARTERAAARKARKGGK